MAWWVWLVIAVSLFEVVVVLWLVPRVVGGMLSPLASAYPPAEPAEDTVWRHRQSMSIGMVNMGLCFDMGADDAMLHIRPNRFARWWRMPAMSIPWEDITDLAPGSRTARNNARIGKHTVWLPKWVRELATPGSPR